MSSIQINDSRIIKEILTWKLRDIFIIINNPDAIPKH